MWQFLKIYQFYRNWTHGQYRVYVIFFTAVVTAPVFFSADYEDNPDEKFI